MKNFLALFLSASVMCTSAMGQGGRPFPEATPESVGMTRASLEALDEVVKGFIARDEAVGAELMVIKDRKTVWHTAHGLKDSVTKAPMEIDGIFCVRSQTKPVVGSAVQMLIDEGKVSLDDHAAKFLPEFDTDSHRAITIKNLLEHRSGLKLSSLLGVDHKTLKGVSDVAALAAKSELEFEPGTSFNYSDDGADTLATIVETVSGMPVADFITSRILVPLGMSNTVCVLKKDDARYARVNSNHGGATGAWSRFWSPADEPVFPYFLGSQALYSTCEDYAKFLCLWADGGEVNGKRLLSEGAVKRGLTPASSMEFPTGFKGVDVWYGQLWQLWVKPGDPPARVAFGHGGSDGTGAWMWPERDLIVLYFTQSRGGLSSITIEKEIDRLLIRGEDPAAPQVAAANLDALAGVYWDNEEDATWAVAPSGQKLRLEIQGKTVADAVEADEGWKFELEPGVRLRFEIGAKGVAEKVSVSAGGKTRTLERLEPDAALPSAEKVEAMVRGAHRLDTVRGVIRREGTIKLPALGVDSRYVELLGDGRSLIDFQAKGVRTRVLVRDGKAWARQGDKPAEELKGARALQSIFQRAQVIFGGWTGAGAKVGVLKRVEEDGRPMLLVRLVPRGGNGCVLYVDESSGRVEREDQLVVIPGLGSAVGMTTRWEGFEEVGGAVLPKSAKSEYVTPLLGKGETRFDTQAVVEGGEELFTVDGQ